MNNRLSFALAACLALGVTDAAQAQAPAPPPTQAPPQAQTPAPTQPQARTHFGPQVGYNFDFEAAVLGILFSVPVKPTLDFVPSFNIFVVDIGSASGINLDMKFRPLRAADWLFVGGGVNMTHTKALGSSNTDPGINLLGGVEWRRGNVHPFAEFRWSSGKSSSSQLVGGVNVTLGGGH